MKKSNLPQLPVYFDRYIHLTDNESIYDALKISLNELQNVPIETWNALGNKVYAADKWTIKDILQHIIDTERVFCYRITAIARGDKQKMISYDENLYAAMAEANRRSIDDLIEELILIRKSLIVLFKSFTPEMLLRSGYLYNGNEISVLSMGFMIAGHQRWHFKIIEERYLPLLKQ